MDIGEEVIVLFSLAFIWTLFASIQDIRKREIFNWVSFSLIIFALGFRFFYSLFSDIGFSFFYQGLIGLFIFFIIGNLLYYSRVFAGGDAKLMMAFGAILPFSTDFMTNVNTYFIFMFLFLLSGSLYGLIFTFYLSTKNYKEFNKDFIRRLKINKRFYSIFVFIGFVLIIMGFFDRMFLFFGILIFVFPFFYLYAKSVDSTSMIKKVKVSQISEGEWLHKPVKIGKKTIKPSWDGLTSEEVKLIKKKLRHVTVKQGIPFVPIFFISLILLFYSVIKDLFLFLI